MEDQYGRTITMANDGNGNDVYTITDSGANEQFTLSFPTGTDYNSQVLNTINSMEPS